jgi:transcriptional regulator with XRE-family HTH domain
MLGQIENGKSMPTIGVLWKIATALNIPVAQLLSGQETKGTHVLRPDEIPVIISEKGGLQSRALFPADSANRAGWPVFTRILRGSCVQPEKLI